MIDRNVLKFWTEKEKRLEAAHLLDRVEGAFAGETGVTPFLSGSLKEWLQGLLARAGLAYIFGGGFPEPERVRLLFGPSGEELDLAQADITLLMLSPYDSKVRLGHRQILGSLMGLGLKRDVIGDIREGRSCFYVAVTSEIAPFLVQNWNQAGRDKIRAEVCVSEPELLPEQGEEKSLILSSPRLDAAIAGSFSLARTDAQELIQGGLVKRNDLTITKNDAEISPHDVLSCRGHGRIKVLTAEGSTRKGRLVYKVLVFRGKDSRKAGY